MKRLSKQQQLYWSRVRDKRFAQRLNEAEKKKVRNRMRNAGHEAGGGRDSCGKRIPITAPQGIDVINPKYKDHSFCFFQEIIRAVVDEGCSVRLRFSSTSFISPSGALVLYAYIDKAIKLTGKSSVITMSYPENGYVEAVLQLTGINQLLNAATRKSESEIRQLTARRLMKLNKVVSEISVDGRPAGLQLQSFSSYLSSEEMQAIYGGIIEAVTNCAQHAYLGGEFDEKSLSSLGKRWWLLVARDANENIHVIVCDLGIGIPVSFPKKFASYWKELLAGLGSSQITDSFAIEEAMKYAATRTRQSNRGKGLADFKKPVDKIRGSRLHVLSNNGSYVYRYGNKKGVVAGVGIDSRESLCGTLVEWVLPAKDLNKVSME